MTSNIWQLTDRGLEALRKNEGWAVIAVVYYGSKPCDHYQPEFEKLAEKWEGNLQFAMLQASENPSAVKSCNVKAVPTTLIFKDGKEVTRWEGPYSFEALWERLTDLMRKHHD